MLTLLVGAKRIQVSVKHPVRLHHFSILYTAIEIIYWMKILGIIQAVASALVLTFFLIKMAPILWHRAQKRFLEEDADYSLKNLFGLKRLLKNLARLSYGIYNIFSDFTVLYYFVYTLCAILGVIFVSNPNTYMFSNFFVMFLLFDLIFRAPLLHHIVSAIWRPRTAILLTIVLFFIIEYIFTLWAYYFFSQDYRGQCDSLKTCLMVTIDNTFKVDTSSLYFSELAFLN